MGHADPELRGEGSLSQAQTQAERLQEGGGVSHDPRIVDLAESVSVHYRCTSDMWKSWRSRRNLSTRELARLVSTSPSTISAIELGVRAPSVTVLHLICEELGLDDSERAEALRLSFEAAQRLAAPAKEAA